MQRRALLSALEMTGGDVDRAARALGIPAHEIRALVSSHVSGTLPRVTGDTPREDDDDEDDVG